MSSSLSSLLPLLSTTVSLLYFHHHHHHHLWPCHLQESCLLSYLLLCLLVHNTIKISQTKTKLFTFTYCIPPLRNIWKYFCCCAHPPKTCWCWIKRQTEGKESGRAIYKEGNKGPQLDSNLQHAVDALVKHYWISTLFSTHLPPSPPPSSCLGWDSSSSIITIICLDNLG